MTEIALPTITRDADGTPSIDFSGAVLPEGLVVEVLEPGSGEQVAEGNSITVHYSGWLWNGGLFDSSWSRGEPISFVLARGSLIEGWVAGLVGQPVGSKVLLVIPSEMGYGNRGVGPIPPGSTLVFVIDVLAAS